MKLTDLTPQELSVDLRDGSSAFLADLHKLTGNSD